jgi:hypothetical protein
MFSLKRQSNLLIVCKQKKYLLERTVHSKWFSTGKSSCRVSYVIPFAVGLLANWHLFLKALTFIRNFKTQNFYISLNNKLQKKNKCCQKFYSKWPLYSRWRPKLNLLVKTTNNRFSKKKFRPVLFLKNSRWRLFKRVA